MKNLKKIARAGLLLGLLGGLTYTGIDAHQRYETKKDQEKKFELSLEKQVLERTEVHLRVRREVLEIIKRQEKILGIKHFGEPEISFDENMPRPNIVAADSSKKPAVGVYHPRVNVIWIDLKRYAQRTLSHELGHFRSDVLSESIGNGNWRSKERFFFDSFFKNITGERLIDEGIAEYFEKKTMKENVGVSLVHKEFKKYLKSFGDEAYYEVGYTLVKPILDKNVDRGIELLIKNPPTKRDLKDILAYRERILGMMEKYRPARNSNSQYSDKISQLFNGQGFSAFFP